MASLAPLPVTVPLLVAALLLGLGKWLPKGTGSIVAIATAVSVTVIAGLLTAATAAAPLVYWFGAWHPSGGIAIGIAFTVDPFGAGLAAFVALLSAASAVFAWGYFDEVGVLFHVLLLTFLAAMAGFCLSGDIFNLFVFFELMSVTAFALTAYRLEASSLAGAIQFTVTNSLAGFIMLWGVALLYGRTGALNLAQIHQALAGRPADALVLAAMVMLFGALLTKAAAVPFHLWLADAHAVAPTPVSVLFSGVMVGLGVFGVARLYWTVFAGVVPAALLSDILLMFGLATATIGAFACLAQRHIKRLLAFSTISHIGVMLVGVAVLTPDGLGGAAFYLLGHGFVKGALFMGAGILLAYCRDIDEIRLRGCGGFLPATGVLFAAGGLLLGGLPIGMAHHGRALIDAALSRTGWEWMRPLLGATGAITGAAILRLTGRVFLGWGPRGGAEAEGPSEREREKQADRPLWLLLTPAAILVAAAVGLPFLPGLEAGTLGAALSFMRENAYAAHVLGGAPWPPVPAVSPPPASILPGLWDTGGAVALAAFELLRHRLPRLVTGPGGCLVRPFFAGLNRLHSGRVGDYVAWLMAGMAAFGGALAVGVSLVA
jgi:multicomponent Na+:H+ antiporter subunit D